jgi:geranylgeranyl pyrophosphate synthase
MANQDEETQEKMKALGQCIGILFQVQDDILDIVFACQYPSKKIFD